MNDKDDDIDNLINKLDNSMRVNIPKEDSWIVKKIKTKINNWKEEKELKDEVMKEAKHEALKELKPELIKQIKQKELDKLSGKNSIWKKLEKEFSGMGNKDIGKMIGGSGNRDFGKILNTKQKKKETSEDRIKRILG